MVKYRFEQIAINSTEKKKPVEEDRFTYLGLEHLDSGSLKVTRFGSEVAPIDEKLVRAMLRYIESFPETLHHPKEENFIFRLLRQHTTEHNAVLDELERQHTLENSLIDALSEALSDQESGKEGASAAVTAAVQRLSGAVWEHMSLEESVIFPAARRHLSRADWATVYQAFSAHQDPLLHQSSEMPMKQLFARIATALQQDASGRTTN